MESVKPGATGRTQRPNVAVFLLEALRGGPASSQQLRAKAEAEGIAPHLIAKSADTLGILRIKDKWDGTTTYELPATEAPPVPASIYAGLIDPAKTAGQLLTEQSIIAGRISELETTTVEARRRVADLRRDVADGRGEVHNLATEAANAQALESALGDLLNRRDEIAAELRTRARVNEHGAAVVSLHEAGQLAEQARVRFAGIVADLAAQMEAAFAALDQELGELEAARAVYRELTTKANPLPELPRDLVSIAGELGFKEQVVNNLDMWRGLEPAFASEIRQAYSLHRSLLQKRADAERRAADKAVRDARKPPAAPANRRVSIREFEKSQEKRHGAAGVVLGTVWRP
jgi:hypothetical protein